MSQDTTLSIKLFSEATDEELNHIIQDAIQAGIEEFLFDYKFWNLFRAGLVWFEDGIEFCLTDDDGRMDHGEDHFGMPEYIGHRKGKARWESPDVEDLGASTWYEHITPIIKAIREAHKAYPQATSCFLSVRALGEDDDPSNEHGETIDWISVDIDF